MACFQNSCYSTHFFPVVSVLFSSVFVLVLQIWLWFIFSAWLFTLRNAMAESKFCQWFSVSEFDNTNTLCFPRSQNHEKIQFESTNFTQVEGNEVFSYLLFSLCSLAWGTRAVYKKTHAVRFRSAIRFRCPKVTYASAETGSSVALLADMSTSS